MYMHQHPFDLRLYQDQSTTCALSTPAQMCTKWCCTLIGGGDGASRHDYCQQPQHTQHPPSQIVYTVANEMRSSAVAWSSKWSGYTGTAATQLHSNRCDTYCRLNNATRPSETRQIRHLLCLSTQVVQSVQTHMHARAKLGWYSAPVLSCIRRLVWVTE